MQEPLPSGLAAVQERARHATAFTPTGGRLLAPPGAPAITPSSLLLSHFEPVKVYPLQDLSYKCKYI